MLRPERAARAGRRPRRRHLRLDRRRPRRCCCRPRRCAASAAATHERLGGPGSWLLALPGLGDRRAAGALPQRPGRRAAPTVLGARRAARRRGRPHAGRPPLHVAGAHPAAPVPRRRARRRCAPSTPSSSAARPPTRRCSPAPATAGVRGRDDLRHDRDRRRLRVRRRAPGRRPRAGRRRRRGAGRPDAGAGLPAATRRRPPRRSPTAGSAPATPASCADGRLTVHRPAGRRRHHRRGQRRARRGRGGAARAPRRRRRGRLRPARRRVGAAGRRRRRPGARARRPTLAELRPGSPTGSGAPAAPRELHLIDAVPTAAHRQARPPRRRPALIPERLMATPAQWVAGARPRTLPAAARARAGRHRRRRRARRLPARCRRCSRWWSRSPCRWRSTTPTTTPTARAAPTPTGSGPMRLVGSGAATPRQVLVAAGLAFAVAARRRAGAGRAVELGSSLPWRSHVAAFGGERVRAARAGAFHHRHHVAFAGLAAVANAQAARACDHDDHDRGRVDRVRLADRLGLWPCGRA